MAAIIHIDHPPPPPPQTPLDSFTEHPHTFDAYFVLVHELHTLVKGNQTYVYEASLTDLSLTFCLPCIYLVPGAVLDTVIQSI